MTQSPITKKLQLKPHQRLLVLGAPGGFAASLDPLPEGAVVSTAARGQFDVVHVFVKSAKELAERAPKALSAVREGGVLWISYPKKSSGVATDLTRDVGWKVVEQAGWGGVAQVSIDDVWSALRFKPEADVQRKPGSAAAPGAMSGATPRAKKPAAAVAAPADLAEALAGSAAARALWDTMAPSHRKEYVGWIEEAKRPDTRARRVQQAIEMMAAGVKNKNEKYVTKPKKPS